MVSISTLATPGTSIDAADVTTVDNELLAHINNIIGGTQSILPLAAGSSATIAAGAITVNSAFMTVDTEGAAATDDLDTLTGGSAGQMLYLIAANSGRVITLRHGVGNFYSWTGTNVGLRSDRALALIRTSAGWSDVAVGTEVVLSPWTALGGSAATIAISSIPATFRHLKLRFLLRSDYAATTDNLLVRFNADAVAANYYTQYMINYASTFVAGEVLGTGSTGITIPYIPGNTAVAGLGFGEMVIENYISTTLRRGCSFDTGVMIGTTTGLIRDVRGKGWWTNTSAAISSITLLPQNGANFLTGSAVELYGII